MLKLITNIHQVQEIQITLMEQVQDVHSNVMLVILEMKKIINVLSQDEIDDEEVVKKK